VGVIGGAVLLVFGGFQVFRSIRPGKEKTADKRETRNLVLLGLVFTGLNPFFIVWWVTVGANLILIALEFASLLGVVFMYLCHVWMDYVWLILVAYLSKRGMDIAGFKWYRITMAFFGALLIYFGLTFLSSAVLA
jgi:threonine/homoserine/homoserine lactone efflux protein